MNAETVSSADLIAEAIVAFTGHGSSMVPRDDAGAVLALVPTSDGERLLEVVKAIVRESERVDADWADVEGD